MWYFFILLFYFMNNDYQNFKSKAFMYYVLLLFNGNKLDYISQCSLGKLHQY